MDPMWCGVDMVQFSYGVTRWNMFRKQTGRIFFFWKEVSSCLPALRGCIHAVINTGLENLFWKDHWLNGRAPMYLWKEEFRASQSAIGTVQDLALILYSAHFLWMIWIFCLSETDCTCQLGIRGLIKDRCSLLMANSRLSPSIIFSMMVGCVV